MKLFRQFAVRIPIIALVFALSALYGATPARAQTITIDNDCGYTVYPGIYPPIYDNGGWQMNPGSSVSFGAPSFNGRIWGRLGCVAGSGTAPDTCQSGQCGGTGLQCAGSTGVAGTSLAEFNIHGGQGGTCPVGDACDWYDLSYVDGIDVPIGIVINNNQCFSPNTCTSFGCPTVMQGAACLSPCSAYGGAYCCPGGPTSCDTNSPYITDIHNDCPADYAYPYDDANGLHTCQSQTQTNNYTVTFCPNGAGSFYPKPPAAPTNLTATAGNSEIILRWTSPSGSLGDWIYRGTTAGGESTTPLNPGSLGITNASFTDTTVSNGTTYYYYVKGGDNGGLGPASSEVSATPGTAATTPTGLSAAAGNGSVTLAWNPSAGANSYDVYRSQSSGGEGNSPIATGITSNSYVNGGLNNGTTYYFKVSAVNSQGTSGQSNEASATPIVLYPHTVTDNLTNWSVISSKSANWELDTTNTAYFNGNPSRAARTVNDTEYLIYTFQNITAFTATLWVYQAPSTALTLLYSTNNGSSYTQTAVTASAYTATTSGWGYYTISTSAIPDATNIEVQISYAGNAWDPEIGPITITYNTTTSGSAPSAPTGLTATAGTGQVALSWAGSSGAASYNVYRGASSGGESGTAIATGITGTTYTNAGLTSGTTYYYKVAAVNSSGTSAQSNEASATPMAATTTEAPFGGTPWAIPGTLYADDYDTGGQGVAYNIPTNSGTSSALRSDSVDLQTCTDTTTNGYNVGWTAAGQWMRYTVNVATAGTYTISLRVAADAAVTNGLHIANSSGTNLSGEISMPSTGSWTVWETVTASVTLPAGQQVLTLDQDTSGYNINYLKFASSGGGGTTEAPYLGTPWAIPGTVQAENYDTGGQGVAYNIGTNSGTANNYRSDGVDLETTTDTGGGYDVGWTAAGQWFRYTVNVATAGAYTVSLRVAADAAVTNGLHISNSSGTNLSGEVSLPSTGGWQTWETVTTSVTLPAGQQVLTVNQDTGGWNFNYMTFASSGGGGTSYVGIWQLTPENSTGLRLDVVANGTANGTLLDTYTSNGTTAQQFAFSTASVVPAGDYNFTKTGGSFCVQPTGTTSGSAVEIYACAGTAAQSWKLVANGAYVELEPSSAGTLCLNNTGTASGSSVTVATCNSSTGQQWSGL